ncbi:exodeoxyribonuclease V subunit alpha [Rhodoferax lacus]|uniref:exodeoxyribonuclease V subunit alpha n=1 Tax=Rhodoferax lacus TaxID=2184758 RepID=UPI001314572A|nr:exodeoxyribonuclease V subunit alpha [Rhodoferax lacus]
MQPQESPAARRGQPEQSEPTFAASSKDDAPLQLPLTGLDQAFAKYLQDSQPSLDARHTMLAALTSHQFGRGHACLDLQLLEQGVAVLGWDARLQSLLPTGLTAAAATLPWTEGDTSPLVLEGTRLYLRRNWLAEQSIRAAIQARLQQPCALPEKLKELLEQLFPMPDGLANTASNAPPVPDWQKVACALAARNKLTLITGGPGTGKTTTVVRLLALLQSAASSNLRVALAAPTGKAAARLSESIASAIAQLPEALRPAHVAPAVTLHKLLHIRPDLADQPTPELAVDLVIVDEASMIDLEMMARLLAAVPLTASLILLGDKDQLASVEAGAVMAQLCEGSDAGHYSQSTADWLQKVAGVDVQAWSDGAPAANAHHNGNEGQGQGVRPTVMGAALAQQTVMLRFSRRFRDDSGIGIWAKAVNAGDKATVRALWRTAPEWQADPAAVVDRIQPQRPQDPTLTTLLQHGWHGWLEKLQDLNDQPCTDAQALSVLQAFASFQVLCAVREGPWGVESLNRRIAAALGFQDQGWYAGRPVMVTRNDYNLSLMNGDVGLCLPHAKGLRVAFPDGQGGVHWVLPSRLDAVESVFAMTVHKSQGSEFAHVCLVLPDKPVAVLTRELLYTGVTRAKTRLTLVLPQLDVLWRAVDAKVIRSGGLGA